MTITLKDMKESHNSSAALMHLCFISLAVFVLIPLISTMEWHKTHDLYRYTDLSYYFKDAFVHGICYPRWLPDLCGGYGYPTFVFYQPGVFFLVLVFQLITGSIIISYYLTLILLFYLSFWGIYKLIGEFTTETPTRFLCLLLYALTPYFYVNLYVRGDISELASILLIPWALFFLMQSVKFIGSVKSLIYIFVSALVLATMNYMHPFPCLFFYPLFLIFAFILCLDFKKKKGLIILGLAMVALVSASLMSAPYWLNAYFMKPNVDFSKAVSGYYSAENHVVSFSQLFSNFWGFKGATLDFNDGMSFQLGLFHFIAATLGVICGYKNKKLVILYLVYLFLIVMMTPLSCFAWKNIPILGIVQFPWRILSVITVVQVICVTGLANLNLRGKAKKWAVYFPFIILAIIWHHAQFNVQKFEKSSDKSITSYKIVGNEIAFITYSSENEFTPKTALQVASGPRGDIPILQISHLNCELKGLAGNSNYHLKYSFSNPVPLKILINQYYFPGWRIYLSDKQIPDSVILENITQDGRMKIEIPPGKNQILEAFYDGPIGWRFVNIAALVPIAGFILLLLFYRLRNVF